MVDIHAHILPYLDDGADSLETAIVMASQAVQSNINHMLASSHGNLYPYSIEDYKKQLKILQTELRHRQIPLTLYPGMEIYTEANTKTLLEQNKLLTINNTNYILIEFPFEESTGNVCNRIAEFQQIGYNIVLAHPERYLFIQKDPELAYFLEDQGCILQLNKGSILGQFGKGCQILSMQMLRDGIVGIIASDTHDGRYRTPSIKNLIMLLRNIYTESEIKLWLSENSSRILKGYPIIRLNTLNDKGVK